MATTHPTLSAALLPCGTRTPGGFPALALALALAVVVGLGALAGCSAGSDMNPTDAADVPRDTPDGAPGFDALVFDIASLDTPADGGSCVTDGDCARTPATPHCDRGAGVCRACLPTPETCGAGMYCTAAFQCAPGCAADSDCAGGAGDAGATPDGSAGAHHRCDVPAHACVDCLGDTDCPGALVCLSEHCTVGCSALRACPTGSDCCGAACVDLFTDNTHCGSCDHTCGAGDTCCGGVCYALATDARHCGGCGTACAVANGVPGCAGGACTVASCFPGRGDCDGMVSNGCEALLDSDPTHCGTCRTVCPTGTHVTPVCTAGICSSVCAAGYLHCSAVPTDGCEVNPTTDVNNCGACGHACTAAHGTGGCVSGACTLTACATGYANCDGMAANGCETATLSDPTNCGACFHVCPTGAYAMATCTAGACGTLCATGHGDCNGLASDGCEATFATDPTHCGGCSTVCTTPPNAVATCSAGACGFICAAGFRDCDGVAANGCEVNFRTDVSNCGACGTVCTLPNGTPACSAGHCAVGSCNAGRLDCDGLVSNGCEVSDTADSSNCGTCGNVCVGSTVCIGGVCTFVNPFPSTGAEGAYNPTSNVVLAPGLHNFTSITIPSGVTVTTSGSGMLDLRATGDVTIAGTINVTGGTGGTGVRTSGGGGGGFTAVRQTAGVGAPGGGGAAPAGAAASGCAANASGGAYGGGAGTVGAGTVGGGGGGGPGGGAGGLIGDACVAGNGGGGATAGAGGQAGGPPYDGQPGQSGTDPCSGLAAGGGGGSVGSAAAMDLAMATTFLPGSGGGGGSGAYSSGLAGAEGGGGGGGGAVRVASPTRITVSGTIRADGGVGGNGSAADTICSLTEGGAGGGGGSGGAIYLAAPTLSVTGTLSAAGASGGSRGANTTGGDGGAGGLGRIRLSASTASCTLSGSLTPAPRSGCALTNAAGFPYIAGYPR